MSLTVYEKYNVEAGNSCLVMGKVTFNVLNQPRTQKPNEYVSDPKPEYVVAIEEPEFVKGGRNNALASFAGGLLFRNVEPEVVLELSRIANSRTEYSLTDNE